jgi:putative transposase
MNNYKPTYAETFMGKAGTETGSDAFGYLTLKVPVVLDESNKCKAWDTSNCVAFTWNRFTEHQIHKNWLDSYESIKKLLPGIKADHFWLKTASSQVLQEVAKSHSGATKSCKTKRKTSDEQTRKAHIKFPGFKSRKHFQSHKYPQQGISFEFKGRTLRLAYGKKPSEWIEATLPQVITESSVKCVTLTHDDKNGFSVCLETIFELPRPKESQHSLVIDPSGKTTLACLRTDGTVWEYDISPLRNLNMKIYQKIDDLMSRRDALPCAVKFATYWKEHKHANKFVGPMPEDHVSPKKPVVSREYQRLTARITKLFAAIRNRSKQYLHTMAKKILIDHPKVTMVHIGDWDRNETIADAPIDAKNETIIRAIQNSNPLGRLIEYLKYKAVFQARKVDKFDEKGTVTTCPECNHVEEKVPPVQRTFICRACGFTAPRVVNASRNKIKIDAYGMWHALKNRKFYSSVRTSLAALSCVNSKRFRARVSLTTGMHGAIAPVRMSQIEIDPMQYLPDYYPEYGTAISMRSSMARV